MRQSACVDHGSLFVCGISLTSGQLVSELFSDCTRSCVSQGQMIKKGYFSIKVYRILGSFEAISVISRVHLICNNFIFYRSSCIL